MVTEYAADRVLSKQQLTILRFYLDGRNDKEIAQLCGCSEATVYEHWRRMARKVGGAHKGDAIADFHRFLASA
jgi:DNA-binding CsgD family transcriptional regulator